MAKQSSGIIKSITEYLTDAADGKGGPERRLENVADAFSLHGLHIAVCDQGADGSAYGIAGAVIGENQMVF